jgi:predicted anti-sigma-YlaC factor YlaD
MDCNKFQDSISDYLDSALDARLRAECAAHRLICRGCRELYNDVRAAVQTLSSVAQRPLAEPHGLEDRIIAATTAGEMLSCVDFDKLIERYFDGVILAPTFQTFQAHFEKCLKCRRLMGGIEETISMCKEIKETEIEMPESLHERIVAATVGAKAYAGGNRLRRRSEAIFQFLGTRIRPLWTPQIAVAALIFAASSLLILSRFGSVKGMATSAGIQAESLVNQGQRAITSTGAIARTGLQRVSFLFDDGALKPTPMQTPSTQNKSGVPSPSLREPVSNPATGRNGKTEPASDQDKSDQDKDQQKVAK